jgi:DNA-binding response OmpR family regulator
MSQGTILVVDDEPAIVEVIRNRLERDGFSVRASGDGESVLPLVSETSPDLIILDLMLPGIDGFEVLRQLRRAGHGLPVIVLTARDDDVDIVVGLELGADDYMAKPFNPRELLARVHAVLRRRAEALALADQVADLEARLTPDPAADQSIPDHGLHFDPGGRRAWFKGQLLDLRPREFDLLLCLSEHPGQVLSRAGLLDLVWGLNEYIDERTVDVHVHRLRQKLAAIDATAEPIQTERGIGYRIET